MRCQVGGTILAFLRWQPARLQAILHDEFGARLARPRLLRRHDPGAGMTEPSTPGTAEPAPVAAGAARNGSHPVFDYAEKLGKLATVVVGVLYVLGLLISNIQLMELGISDF